MRLVADALAITVNYLRTHADVSALVAGRIYTRIPADPVYPLVRLSHIVDSMIVPRHLVSTRIQVEVFGADQHDAPLVRDIADTCRGALEDLPGWENEEGWVSAVLEETGLAPLPDPDRSRYMFDTRIYALPRQVE